jgi:hypothetical protein
VQQRGNENVHVLYLAECRERVRNLDAMSDVRSLRPSLPPLFLMRARRVLSRIEKRDLI